MKNPKTTRAMKFNSPTFRALQLLVSCAVVVVIVSYILSIPGCEGLTGKSVVTTSDTVTVIKTDTTTYVVFKTKPQIRDSFIFLPAADIYIDTAAIIQKFFTKFFVVDTLSNDSVLTAVLFDTLYNNKISSRRFDFKINRPTTITQIVNNTTISPKDKPRFYVGGSLIMNKGLRLGAGPEIFYARKKQAIGCGYDLINQSISTRIYFKL